MRTRIIIIATSLLLLHLACEEKKPITQELCESKTNRADCEAAGCTYTCGMVFVRQSGSSSKCVARRRAGRCLAVVKFAVKNDDTNNGDVDYDLGPSEIGWLTDRETQNVIINNENHEYFSMFRIQNPFPFTVEVLGYHQSIWDHLPADQDPCYQYDSDGAPDIPWEGSCETDWWSQDMWDDVLTE